MSDAHRSAILALAGRAGDADGVPPLNEDAHLALTTDCADHLLHERDDRLLGYVQWQPGPSTAQLVVDPLARRHGIGTALADELRQHAAERLWAFGDLPPAQAFAAARALGTDRELWMMERTPGPAPVAAPSLPPALRIRSFQPGDEDALLAVNRAAFAHHPEQGALDGAGLARRMAEPWFDPGDLLLGFDGDGLAGFHWTKPLDATTGEVYVVGVSPRAQGRGYGRALLDAGLRHLAATGRARAVLYVDKAESVAVQMYEKVGFSLAHRDVLYAGRPRQGEDS